MHLDHFPSSSGRLLGFLGKNGQQPSANQRRLSAAGTAHDGHKTAMIEQAIERKDLVLASEEKVLVFETIRTQARKWAIS